MTEKFAHFATSGYNADARSKAILKHYCQTISKLTGKSEKEIESEVLKLANQYKEEAAKEFNQLPD